MDDGPRGQAHESQGRTSTAGEGRPGLEEGIAAPAEGLCSPAGSSGPSLQPSGPWERHPGLQGRQGQVWSGAGGRARPSLTPSGSHHRGHVQVYEGLCEGVTGPIPGRLPPG